MKKIDPDNYNRRGLFNSFKDRDIPYFSTTCNIEIQNLKKFVKLRNISFFVSFSYIISVSVNRIPQLRHRIIDGELYEFKIVDPGYTVLLDDETFSFCDSKFFEDFHTYYEYAIARIEEVKNRPDQNNADKNHMFFITSIPWFSFTSFVHPYDKLYSSIPIITIGKYFEQGDSWLIPIAIQVHHGVVDGLHVGKYYACLEELCKNPEVVLGKIKTS
ncbi:MAG: chloramphenicol acetyltransferase [Deltaproteobacteria bacterium]|nr:chloramphenicol acetyltransferase [Deltaproteobacteria bacterium]